MQQQPLCHGQQLCEVSSPSKLPVKGHGVNCDLELGEKTLIPGHDTIV